MVRTIIPAHATNRAGKKVFRPHSLRRKKHASKGKTSGFKKSSLCTFGMASPIYALRFGEYFSRHPCWHRRHTLLLRSNPLCYASKSSICMVMSVLGRSSRWVSVACICSTMSRPCSTSPNTV